MVKTLWAIVAGVIMLLLSALGIEKNKTKRERNAKEARTRIQELEE